MRSSSLRQRDMTLIEGQRDDRLPKGSASRGDGDARTTIMAAAGATLADRLTGGGSRWPYDKVSPSEGSKSDVSGPGQGQGGRSRGVSSLRGSSLLRVPCRGVTRPPLPCPGLPAGLLGLAGIENHFLMIEEVEGWSSYHLIYID